MFADIVNVLLFDGRQVVSADDLETVKDRSQYKADGKIHEQERDVSKVLKLMSVLTDDARSEEVIQELSGKGGTSMCTVLDKVENRGIEKGLAQGLEQGKLEGMTQIYYTEMNYSADQIAQKLDAPVDLIQQLINDILKK